VNLILCRGIKNNNDHLGESNTKWSKWILISTVFISSSFVGFISYILHLNPDKPEPKKFVVFCQSFAGNGQKLTHKGLKNH